MKFIPYICCGDPDMAFTYELVKVLAPYSSMIELGIPFSDPIADGKTIQMAASRALKNGANIEKIFSMAERFRKERIIVPFVFMTYCNIIYSYGKEKFLRKMNLIRIQGLIIPDLPFGEDKELEILAKKYRISIINLIAPNTSKARALKILKKNDLFTYLVSVAGTTGARNKISDKSLAFVKRIKNLATDRQPLFVGFGISNAVQAKQFINFGANGVIVGSEIINIYSRHTNVFNALREIEEFARKISDIHE